MNCYQLLFICIGHCFFSTTFCVTVDDDIEVSGSSRFNIFTAISNMADRAANTFSDSFLPGVHKSLDQGHQGSQSPTRNKRRFKSKKHHQSSAILLMLFKENSQNLRRSFPKGYRS